MNATIANKPFNSVTIEVVVNELRKHKLEINGITHDIKPLIKKDENGSLAGSRSSLTILRMVLFVLYLKGRTQTIGLDTFGDC